MAIALAPGRRGLVEALEPRAVGIQTLAGLVVITALPAPVNLRLYAGDDFIFTLSVSWPEGIEIDLGEYDVRAQIRERTSSPDIAGEFIVSTDGNVIVLHLDSATSADLPARSVWDCQTTATDGFVTTLAAGTIEMTEDVTRP